MFRCFPLLLLIIAAGLGASDAVAQVDAVTAARYDLRLGFSLGGKVMRVAVKPGQRVEVGQVLMELEDEEGKALIDLYTLRAQSDLAVRAEEAAVAHAQLEESAILTASAASAATPIEVERAKLATVIARLKLESARQQREEAQQQLVQAQARHDQFVMRAPTAGVIEAIIANEGEVVEALAPVLRLVVTDPLWIDAPVPTAQTLSFKVGDPAWVVHKLPGFAGALQPIEGRIIHLASVADGGSDTRMVRVEIPNTQRLPASGHVSVHFTRPEAQVSATTGDPATTEAR